MHSRIRALIDRFLPWYDPAAEASVRRDVHATIRASKAARTRAEEAIDGTARIREAYRRYADGLDRR